MKKNRKDGSSGDMENRDKDLKPNRNKLKKNMDRMGGRGGLSLAAFANAKTRNDNYNPCIIKKQKEFYRNAKFVQKYKKLLNQQSQSDSPSTSKFPLEGEKDADSSAFNKKSKKERQSLNDLYEKTKEEKEKAKAERAAEIQAKAETEAKRKTQRQKMLKKTKSGQPVMKYRIERILETLQNEAR